MSLHCHILFIFKQVVFPDLTTTDAKILFGDIQFPITQRKKPCKVIFRVPCHTTRTSIFFFLPTDNSSNLLSIKFCAMTTKFSSVIGSLLR